MCSFCSFSFILKSSHYFEKLLISTKLDGYLSICATMFILKSQVKSCEHFMLGLIVTLKRMCLCMLRSEQLKNSTNLGCSLTECCSEDRKQSAFFIVFIFILKSFALVPSLRSLCHNYPKMQMILLNKTLRTMESSCAHNIHIK